MDYRQTSQLLMPALKPSFKPGSYDIYPSFCIGEGKICRGLSSLAGAIRDEKLVIIDGYAGVFFEEIKDQLDSLLRNSYGNNPHWIDCSAFLKDEMNLNSMLSPCLGGDDPLFGRRTGYLLRDFFARTECDELLSPGDDRQTIIFGIGAALFSGTGLLVYIDLPKNELQYRARAASATNIGTVSADDPKKMYKRYYFIDWVVLNRHKEQLINRIDIIADSQRPDDITWMSGKDFRQSLEEMSATAIRPRPWFEPGAWGGSWIKDHIQDVSRSVPNYAWSFELITPENGLLLESSGLLLEFSFDFLMYHSAASVLGNCYSRYGTLFPIRFDFLDTFNGGNLSLQCHPGPGYIKENFGEDLAQEESYYILDTRDNASVWLGFSQDAEKEEFRAALESSEMNSVPFPAEKFVLTHPAAKHDLFLIPYGTIHASGKNNLVLEISTTPYIFTFKMYDWLRPDLDGKPRTLNIQRAMDNLNFDRKGEKVYEELLSKPELKQEGADWKLFSMPTHQEHSYNIDRYHFNGAIEICTDNKCHVHSLTEGKSIRVITGDGRVQRFSYAETFIVPAATGKYTVINDSEGEAILVTAFIR